MKKLMNSERAQRRIFWSADFPVRSSGGTPRAFEKFHKPFSCLRCCGLESPRSNLLPLLLVAALAAVSGCAHAASGPKIQFEKTVYDVGRAAEGEIVSGHLSFFNAGDAMLEVTNLDTSCGCTVASVKPDKLKPGEKGEILFTLNLTNIRGPQEKRITVPCNDPQNPKTDLMIKVDVTPIFEFDPQLIYFGDVAPGHTARGEIHIKRVDGKKLIITEVEKEKDYITTKIVPDEQSHGQAATLVVEAKPTGAPGTFTAMLQIYVTNVAKASLLIPVAGQLLGGITLEPETLTWNVPDPDHFPGPDPDGTTVRSVIVSSTAADTPLEVHDFESTFDDLLVRVVPVEKGKKFKVLLKLDQPLKESAEGVLTFETNLRTYPRVELPLKFNVAKP